MQITDEPAKATNDLDTQRAILTRSITDITNDLGTALRDAGLHFPVYITVRSSGNSLATIATPLDPSETDWDRASEVVCQVLGRWVGCERLVGWPLVCAVANAARISASELLNDDPPSNSSQ